ncbi:hypothetical protein PLESTB_001584600 [Pleodorina starrii]|uniref:AMMECR1 domain-containing protein n=1 Tax=Pleodorina starrii TaxID=330485 RepID=A0A9W6BY21_9CHLO|nr:hypothetical protein PLESTM_000585800 [Pleodorina starrii]GLC60198.1 hypothetical protein PLESTB_001584600 [Pleodorina starrii]GLC65959.1 hypothetical protein PLESTF_000366700 [Pleodorina starrii]
MFSCWKGSKRADKNRAGFNVSAMVLQASTDAPQDPNIATRDHCVFAFSVLHSHLTGSPSPVPNFPDSRCALFVTWNTHSSAGHWRLRGCIGTLEPKQLRRALHDYALNSSLRDHRFSPIKLKELPSLQCKVSLLARFEKAAGWQDWTVGVHGIIIHFTDPDPHARGARRTATFLPDVAPEQGWNQQQAVDALIRKAGYNGSIGPSLRESLSLERYQSTIAAITYDEFMAAIQQADDEEEAAEAVVGAVGSPSSRDVRLKVAA